MSEVWSATDFDLERRVAVKLLAPSADPARFSREARAIAPLAHPNICTLYAYGDSDGRPYIVLEYLSGGTLEDRLAAGRPLPDDETERIAAGIAAGLAEAHAHGVVHRDLKPANVLFDAEGRAKIADFGIARIGEGGGLTAAGTVLGTAAYISPEQAAGEPATPASDVYAFGVILFRMLTGRLPFEAEDALAMAAMHRDRPAPPVTSFRPDAPPRLESLAAAALAKSPADRPRDGAALAAELGPPGRAGAAATAVTQVLRPTRDRSRTPLVALGAALLAAAGVAVAIAVTFRGGAASPPLTTSFSTTRPHHVTTTPPATTAEVAPATTPPATTAAGPTTTSAPAPPPTTAPVTTAPPATTIAPLPPPPPVTTAATSTTATTSATTAPATTAATTTGATTTTATTTAATTTAATTPPATTSATVPGAAG
jgi:eukaryotic-like serine/threonine-protein kinase